MPEQSTEVQFTAEPVKGAASRAAAGDRFAIERPWVRAPDDTLRAVRDLAVRTTAS